jgi:glycosyltransferase involved in cell wall biosynthesis
MSEQIVLFYVGNSNHALFREQLRAIPDGYVYRSPNSEQDGGGAATRGIAAHGRRMDWLLKHGERAAIRSLSYGGFVRRTRLQLPPKISLVHSAQFLLRDWELPYVVDFECIEAFVLYQRIALRRPWARARLTSALIDPRLRLLLPWSEAARRGLQSALGPSIARRLADRTVTVLPAIHPVAERPRMREPGPLRVLFVGTAFLAKGGVEAVRAVERVRATHDVSLDIVSDVPDLWGEEVGRLRGVTLHSWPAGGDIVRSLFGRSDVLLFPSHMDTLGFVMLEAMANGMPVLAARHFATPEIVEHDVSGLLCSGENALYGDDGLCRFDHTLPPPRTFRQALVAPSDAYIDRLAGSLARLAEDRGLHERLASGALERVREGPLSVARRREALGHVYRQALAI